MKTVISTLIIGVAILGSVHILDWAEQHDFWREERRLPELCQGNPLPDICH